MNKHIRNASLILAGFASAVAFQNCSPANLVESPEAVSEKPEVIGAEPIIESPAPVAETPTESVGLASKLLKNRKWILDSYSEGNDEIAIDEAAKIQFEMSSKSLADEDRVCAGDCGRAFPIVGTGLCGDFSGVIKVRFAESVGYEVLSFGITEVAEICKSEDIIDGATMIAITDQIFQDLENSEQISIKNKMLIVRTENRTAIFKAHISF